VKKTTKTSVVSGFHRVVDGDELSEIRCRVFGNVFSTMCISEVPPKC
jgi:hypothetical protein